MALISSKCGKDDPKGEYVYEYPRPAMTADNVIFGFGGNKLQILLVERGIEPFKGSWALPGGFLRMSETIEECSRRELREETNVHDVYLEQFHVFSDPRRDPRGRVVTVAFIALVRPSDHAVIGGDDASNAMWFDVDMLPPLAFDHLQIIDKARVYLKEMLRIKPLAFNLLNEVFSVDELRNVYEVITGNTYDRRNFYRKLMQSNLLKDADEDSTDVSESHCSMSMHSDANNADVLSPQEHIISSYCKSDLVPLSLKNEDAPKKSKRKLRFFRFNEDRDLNNDSDEDASIKDLFSF